MTWRGRRESAIANLHLGIVREATRLFIRRTPDYPAGTGNGYLLAEIVGASSPSGWAGWLKVKTPASAVAGYSLLYSNP